MVRSQSSPTKKAASSSNAADESTLAGETTSPSPPDWPPITDSAGIQDVNAYLLVLASINKQYGADFNVRLARQCDFLRAGRICNKVRLVVALYNANSARSY